MDNNPGWTIRPAAERDLTDIWLEGASRWGAAQANDYADGLFALFDLLARFPKLAPERSEFTPTVRVHPIGAHLVIYRAMEEGAGQGVEIIRLLHTRQNLKAFLIDG